MDEPTKPLQIDLRLVLESVSGTLAFVLAGLAAVELPGAWPVIAPLVVGAVIVFINRLLGRSSEAAISALTEQVKALIAQNTVYRADAKPAVVKAAEEAGAAMRPGAPIPPVTSPWLGTPEA